MNSAHVMSTFARYPIELSHGDGAWLWDTTGRRYLDGLAGIAVNTLGHRHPRLVNALTDQLNRVIHTSNLYHHPLQEQTAATLCRISGMDKVFFCNSGLEANEAAIKLARLYGHNRGIAAPKIIVFEKAFHGRSLATLAATGNPKLSKGFGPMVEGFIHIPLNDEAALRQAIASNPDACAVFVETIQGEGGINPSRIDFLRLLRAVCDQHQMLLMLDEVQCGIGRTGKWFAHQWADIVPDVMPLAKGLGSGVPIGAIVAKGPAADVFTPGTHGTTFGGNPLALRAALETIAIVEEENLIEHAGQVGRWIAEALRARLADTQQVLEVRGQGLMIGVELSIPAQPIVMLCANDGLLLNVTADKVIRLLPPLILTQEQAASLVDILVANIQKLITTSGAC